MRCFSLAERWIELGGRAECWGSVTIPFAEQRAESLGVLIVAQPRRVGSILLVDVYDEAERLALSSSQAGSRRVLIDDLGASVPCGYDAVWNPNAYGDSSLYQGFSGEVIAGPDYIPIRRGLPHWVGDGTGAVSFGAGELPMVLRLALSQLPGALGVPAGWSVGECSPPGWCRVNPADHWSDLKHARWLITAGGSTLWEAATVRIPVVVVVFAENQALVGEWAAGNGAPVMDVRGRTDPVAISAELARMVLNARALPPLESGAEAVARRLFQLAA